MKIKDIMRAAVMAKSRPAGEVTLTPRYGGGTPSPDTPAPIRPALKLLRDDDSELVVWGGELDFSTGELTVTQFCGIIEGTEKVVSTAASSTQSRRFSVYVTEAGWPRSADTYFTSSHFVRTTAYKPAEFGKARIYRDTSYSLFICFDDASVFGTIAELKAWFAGQLEGGTPVQVLYTLETPETVALTATEMARATSALGKQRMIAAMLRERKEN